MDPALTLALGVTAALGAAASFGTASLLQYRSTHEVPERTPGKPGILVDLIRRPRWRWSIILAVCGFALQVLALRLAPLALVQPLLVTGVLWYVLLSSATTRRRPHLMIMAGTLLCVAGLSAFLVIARPSAAPAVGPGLRSTLPLGAALGATVVGCLVLFFVLPRQWGTLPLAMATGVCYGVTASLVRALAPYFSDGPGVVLQQWETYGIVVLGPIGVLLNQNSYQAGRIGVPALAIITVVDPLVAIAVGLVWLGEPIRTGPWHLAGETLALAVLVSGVVLVASRAPHVTRFVSQPHWSAQSHPQQWRGAGGAG